MSLAPLQVNKQKKYRSTQTKGRTYVCAYIALCVDRVDAKRFFIFVLRVVDEDEYFSFSRKLLRSEAQSNTVRFARTNLEK